MSTALNQVNQITPPPQAAAASEDKGIKTALIALAILFGVKLIVPYHGDLFNLLAAGIYLGLAKWGKYTMLIFVSISIVIYMILSWSSYNNNPDIIKVVFSNVFGSVVLVLIVVALGAIIRFIAKKRRNKTPDHKV
jgi:hypothetical protein